MLLTPSCILFLVVDEHKTALAIGEFGMNLKLFHIDFARKQTLMQAMLIRFSTISFIENIPWITSRPTRSRLTNNFENYLSFMLMVNGHVLFKL